MIDMEILNNYKKSLLQKYYAICLDIDGTLTIPETKNVDDRAIKQIIELLKKKVPIVFITGRGETGLNDLKKDIYPKIREDLNIADDDIMRVYALTNDGARLFSSVGCDYDTFLSKSEYVFTNDELNQLSSFNEIIKKIKVNSEIGKYFKITYSEDSTTKKIINIRILVEKNNENITDLLFDNIDKIIQNNKFEGLHITRGFYKEQSVIQIGTATKDLAIERAERIIGVPKDSMIRIGDCGDKKGNDYAMLNCSQGYSVDKTSGSKDSCFPIIDDFGNILKGVDATIYIMKKAKLLPTVCLEKSNLNYYKKEFAKVESNIVRGSRKLIGTYNDLINNNFRTIDGIKSIFDEYSGSVKIPMYEWEIIENNPLKDFWSLKKNNNYIYSIRDDKNYLLRGSGTYYYFLANRASNNGKDLTTKEDIKNWYENYIDFFENSTAAIIGTEDMQNVINKKLLLGILDNCRNVLLVLLNHNLLYKNENRNIILDISYSKDKNMVDINNSLFNIDKLMSEICFYEDCNINKENVVENIEKILVILRDNYNQELLNQEKENYSKDYRAYREIDNFAENYVAVSLYNKKKNDKKNIDACGLSYGGIELPVLAKMINQKEVERILLLKFNKEVSGYTNKQLLDLRRFDISDFGGLDNANEFQNAKVDLFDDNVLTGKTLQLATNTLYDCNITVSNMCIVRYPSINRIEQMFINGSSSVDYHLFFNYIHGLCFSSPYSWKDNGWKNSDGKIVYTDTLGTFDLCRKKIIECLIKNHDYKDNSEVGEYKRRLVR